MGSPWQPVVSRVYALPAKLRQQARDAPGAAMADLPAWKKMLQEPNASGWIGFFVLVVIIGVATIWLGGNDRRSGGESARFIDVAK